MKKILLAVAIIAGINGAKAQDVKFGAKAGLNVAYFISNTESDIAGPKYNFHLGGTAEIKLTDKFSIQPELLYSAQGLTFDGFEKFDHKALIDGELKKAEANMPAQIAAVMQAKGLSQADAQAFVMEQAKPLMNELSKLKALKEVGAEGNGYWDFKYLNIPVMAKYYVTDKLSLEAGPQIGILLSAKKMTDLKLVGDGKELPLVEPIKTIVDQELAKEYVKLGKNDYDLKDNIKSVDFGFNFGTSYNFTENINLGLRYSLGLTNFEKKPNTKDDYSKNAVIQVSVGYTF